MLDLRSPPRFRSHHSESLHEVARVSYICPQRYADPCPCRRPNRVLYDSAIADLGIVAADSFVVGDSPEDIRAANVLGARGCLVRTGWAADPAVVASIASEAAIDAPSIVEAADWILSSLSSEI